MSDTTHLEALTAWTFEPFVSFDLHSTDPGSLESVDVRPSAVQAIESDARFPGACRLRTTGGYYLVDGTVDEAIALLAGEG